MAPRTLDYDTGMESLRTELVYTEARLLKDKNAADLAPVFKGLQERQAKVAEGQRAAWREETIAEAGVDYADDSLDDRTIEVSEALLNALKRNRESPRYTRYFKTAPNAVVRLGLESQLETVVEWPASLKGEPEDPVKEQGTLLEKDITDGRAAIEERNKAMAKRADHRVREIVRLVDDVNGARLSVYGQLVTRVEERKLPRTWPDRFFRQEQRARRKTLEV